MDDDFNFDDIPMYDEPHLIDLRAMRDDTKKCIICILNKHITFIEEMNGKRHKNIGKLGQYLAKWYTICLQVEVLESQILRNMGMQIAQEPQSELDLCELAKSTIDEILKIRQKDPIIPVRDTIEFALTMMMPLAGYCA